MTRTTASACTSGFMMTTLYRKKMIEVAIPLDTTNKESALRKRKAFGRALVALTLRRPSSA